MTTSRLTLLAILISTRTLAAQATVTGTVFDSLRVNAPLSGASVVIVELSRYATADAHGRFRFDSVPAGHYAVTFLHPSLDSLDLAAGVVPLVVPERGTVNIRLATPSSDGAYARLCPGARDFATGIVFGRVRDIDDATPLRGAIVTAGWTEYALDGGKMRARVVRANSVTNAAGAYVLCGLPADVSPQIYALAEGAAAGPVTASLGAHDMAHLNIGVSRKDIAARLTAEELVDTTRANKVGSGGQSTIGGVVRGADGRPIPLAVVAVLGSDREVRADSNGRFSLMGVAAGTRTVEARAIGLAPVATVVDLRSGVNLELAITLERRAQPLAEVSVLGKSAARADLTGFDERKAHAIGHFLTADDIEKRPSMSIPVILDRIPTLNVMMVKHTLVVLMHGGHYASNLCSPSYFVDGIPSDLETVNLTVQATEIRGIEVYTTGEALPPQFDRGSSKGGCGSIIIWTKK